MYKETCSCGSSIIIDDFDTVQIITDFVKDWRKYHRCDISIKATINRPSDIDEDGNWIDLSSNKRNNQ